MLKPPSDEENDMLDLAFGLTDTLVKNLFSKEKKSKKFF